MMKNNSPLNPTGIFYNNGVDKYSDEVNRLIAVRPSELQLKFSSVEYYSFIHFGMNTFTGKEWGTGKESPSQFAPEKIDTDQWVQVLKNSGSKGIIFTAKHHDGFCLFQTEYTDHSIKNSPYLNGKGDIVKQLSDSCSKYGLLFGIYLSPWDRHEKTYGTDAYNDYFVNQLTELCTNYGDIFCFWFDGAKGADAPEFQYDFERYYNTIHSLQPNALIANCGSDVRWIGNEAGKSRESEWSVVPVELINTGEIQKKSQKDENDTRSLKKIKHTDSDLGSRKAVGNSEKLIWYPAEADVSIHRGWFYSKKPKRKKAKDLAEIYFNTVGKNASLLMNVPPSKNGIIEKKDVQTLEKFGELIKKPFVSKLDYIPTYMGHRDGRLDAISENGSFMLSPDDCSLTFSFDGKRKIKAIVLKEDISFGQRTEKFEIYSKRNGKYVKKYASTVIGSKKIIRFSPLKAVRTDEIKIVFTQSRGDCVIKAVEFYG